jgi:hypothetical protein
MKKECTAIVDKLIDDFNRDFGVEFKIPTILTSIILPDSFYCRFYAEILDLKEGSNPREIPDIFKYKGISISIHCDNEAVIFYTRRLTFPNLKDAIIRVQLNE